MISVEISNSSEAPQLNTNKQISGIHDELMT